MSMNSIFLTGYIGKKPEVKNYGDKTKVTFSICQNKQSNGEEKQVWIPIETWDKNAEFVRDYLDKGSWVLMEGRLDYNSWQTDEGEFKSRLFVVAEKVESKK